MLKHPFVLDEIKHTLLISLPPPPPPATSPGWCCWPDV